MELQTEHQEKIMRGSKDSSSLCPILSWCPQNHYQTGPKKNNRDELAWTCKVHVFQTEYHPSIYIWSTSMLATQNWSHPVLNQ